MRRPKHILSFSAPERDLHLGARAQDWLSSIQASTTTAQARPGPPEGNPAHEPMQRYFPWKGRAIPCGTCLALAHGRDSDAKDMLGAEH